MTLNRTRVIRPAVVLLFLLLVAWLAFGERGFIHLYKMEAKRQRYQERIQLLERKNHELMREIERLRTDEAYIESVARKELNLLKEDETHFHFAENPRGGVTVSPSPKSREAGQNALPGSNAEASGAAPK